MSISGMIRARINELKADRAAKTLTKKKVRAEERRSLERLELAKVEVREKAQLSAYKNELNEKYGIKERTMSMNKKGKKGSRAKQMKAIVKRFAQESTSPVAPTTSDKTREVFGMTGSSGGDKTREILGGGKGRNPFYD